MEREQLFKQIDRLVTQQGNQAGLELTTVLKSIINSMPLGIRIQIASTDSLPIERKALEIDQNVVNEYCAQFGAESVGASMVVNLIYAGTAKTETVVIPLQATVSDRNGANAVLVAGVAEATVQGKKYGIEITLCNDPSIQANEYSIKQIP